MRDRAVRRIDALASRRDLDTEQMAAVLAEKAILDLRGPVLRVTSPFVVANVVVHASTSMRVRAFPQPGCMRVEVSDGVLTLRAERKEGDGEATLAAGKLGVAVSPRRRHQSGRYSG